MCIRCTNKWNGMCERHESFPFQNGCFQIIKYIFVSPYQNILARDARFRIGCAECARCDFRMSPSNLLILFSFYWFPKAMAEPFVLRLQWQQPSESNDKSSQKIYCNRYIAAFVYPRILLLHIGRALLEIIRLTHWNHICVCERVSECVCVCGKFLRSRVSIFGVAINLITRSVLLNFHQRTQTEQKKNQQQRQ